MMDFELLVRQASWHLEDDSPCSPFIVGWDREGVEQRIRYEVMREFLRPTYSVFEVGCGYGAGIDILGFPEHGYIGCDLVPELIEQAQVRFPGHEFQLGDPNWEIVRADAVIGCGVVNYMGGLKEDDARSYWRNWLGEAWKSASKVLVFNVTGEGASFVSGHVRWSEDSLKDMVSTWEGVHDTRLITGYSDDDITLVAQRDH